MIISLIKSIKDNLKENKITRQSVINFVGAHPRLTTVLAGVGITVAFGSVGRFVAHEALTSAVGTPTFQIDYVDKTTMSAVPGFQSANAFPCCSCSGCHDENLELHKLAKELLPAQPEAFNKQATEDILSEITPPKK